MLDYLKNLGHQSFLTFWELARIMVPIMILMRIAESVGFIDWIGPWLEPVTALVNLPPEAAIICATSILVGFYGAVAALPVLAGIDLTAAQITSLCLIILFCHAIPMEQAIVRRAGVSFWGTTLLRLVAGIVAAWMVAFTSVQYGFLDYPQEINQFGASDQTQLSHLEWAWSSAQSLFILFGILVLLLFGLDILDRTGITALINKALYPIMRLSGLEQSVTPITTTGVLLGLSYGGGLIIARAKDPEISDEAKFYSLCWLSLCHGLIEDTAVMVAIGGNVWIMLIGRVVLSLVMVRLLMLWFDYNPWSGKRRKPELCCEG